MKKIVIIIGTILIISACVSTKNISDKESKNKESPKIENDSTEYTLISFDFGFDSWFMRYKNNGDVRSIEYYKNWNSRYVRDWNSKTLSFSKGNFFNTSLNFDPEEIDDLDIQRQLFYYFQYVENELKIDIIDGYSPRLIL
jgi:PBP1b-binding outer membrane lipoprotein LpoB